MNSEKVALKQVPSENLSVNVLFDDVKPKHYCEKNKGLIYEATVKLTFENNLHEFSRNYVYELLCEVSLGDHRQPQRLFSIIETRESDSINFNKIIFSYPAILIPLSLGFYIRRHNLDFCKNNSEPCMNLKSLCQDVPTDVNLLVGDVSIPAHKFILAYRSEVFKAMFASEMMENEEGIVKFEVYNASVISAMINFIYTGKVESIEEIRYQLFKAAHQYQIHDLCSICMEYIVFGSDYENIADTLELADLYGIEDLKERAWTFFENHSDTMSKEPNFQNYLIRSINLINVVGTLSLAKKYNMKDVFNKAFEFIGKNFCKLKDNPQFLNLFVSDPCLTREIYQSYCETYAPKTIAK